MSPPPPRKATRHDKASSASSAARAAGQDIAALGTALRGQGVQDVKARVQRVQAQRKKASQSAASPAVSSDEESEDEAMGFRSFAMKAKAARSVPSGGSVQEQDTKRLRLAGLRDAMSDVGDMEQSEALASEGGDLPEPESPVQAQEEPEPKTPQGKKGRGRGKGTSGGDKPVSSAKDGLLDKAKGLLTAKKGQFSDATLWDPKTKQKAVDAMTKQIEGMAERLLSSSNPAAKDTMDAMLAFVETVKQRFDLFSQIRTGHEWILKKPSAADIVTLHSLSPSTLAMIFTFLAKELLKAIEQDSCVRSSSVLFSCFAARLLNQDPDVGYAYMNMLSLQRSSTEQDEQPQSEGTSFLEYWVVTSSLRVII